MALIVEDGTGLTDSNTYADVATFQAYADSIGRGSEVPTVAEEAEALLIRAMYVLESKCWKGYRTYPENPQALDFPRTGLSYDGVTVPGDSIPTQLINAQCQYGLTAGTQSLFGVAPAGTGGSVIEERVEGAVTIKYGPSSGSTSETFDAMAESMISDFECDAGALFGIRA